MRTDKITAHGGVAKCLQKEKGFCKVAGKNLLAALTSDCNGRNTLLSNVNQKNTANIFLSISQTICLINTLFC